MTVRDVQERKENTIKKKSGFMQTRERTKLM